MKEKLTPAPVLVHANFDKRLLLQCDASMHEMGAVLAQCDEERNEKPIAVMPRN